MRDSQHTENIQINKVIGENEKCVFYFTEKLNRLSGQPNTKWKLATHTLNNSEYAEGDRCINREFNSLCVKWCYRDMNWMLWKTRK